MKSKRTFWWFVVVAIGFAAGLSYAFLPRPVLIEMAVAVRGPLKVTVDEDGRTRIKERYVVSAPMGGQLRRVELHAGDAVLAGRTVVAVLEPSEPELLDPRMRAQLEARVRAAEAQVQLAGARGERARAANELAQADLKRADDLAAKRAMSRQELDHARETASAAAEDLRATAYAQQIAAYELEQARAALLRTGPGARAGIAAWDFPLLAPVDGRVLRVLQEDAAVVSAGARLVEVGDPADLEVEIDVLSTDAVRIARGSRVAFEQWGGSGELEGRVRVVEPAGFLKISALGVEEQRVNILVDFTSPAEQRRTLGDAYRVEARIVVWEAADVLKVPVGALFRDRGEWAVYVLRDNRARLTRVTVGHGDGRESEVMGGLAAGSRVVVHPSDRVSDGVAVRVRDVSRRP